MAAVGGGVSEVVGSWFLPSGVVGSLLLLLLLSILLTALCSDCTRHSFDLKESETDNPPSALISVVKLEDTSATARDNPAFTDIQSDGRESSSPPAISPWRSHLGATEINQDVQTNGSPAGIETVPDSSAAESSAEEEFQFTAWRNHLRAPEQQDGRSSANSSMEEPQQTGGGDDSEAEAEFGDGHSVYAKVNKSVKHAPPPRQLGMEEEAQEEEEEPIPPLPIREMEMAG